MADLVLATRDVAGLLLDAASEVNGLTRPEILEEVGQALAAERES